MLSPDILKVGSFLNQQIDTALLKAVGEEIARLYGDAGVTKILTIEASGIALAAAAGMAMDVPVLFAKKHKTSNVDGDVLTAPVHSYTHDTDYEIVVSRDYLTAEDTVLLVDDFLASSSALRGLIQLAQKAGADLAGVAVASEKRFQGGGDPLMICVIKLLIFAGGTTANEKENHSSYIDDDDGRHVSSGRLRRFRWRVR